MNRRILITGGLGYLGGRVAVSLASRGHVVRLTTSRDLSSIDSAWKDHFDIVKADILSESDLATACDNVSTVVHMAALNEIECGADPERAIIVNGIGTNRLLQQCKNQGVERFIYFSTAHVYGSPLQGLLNENSPCFPVHPYASSHLLAENFVLTEHSAGNIEAIIFRLSNAVGAPADKHVNRWSLVANDVCRQAIENHSIVLRSHGLQLRDFLPLEDVACAVSHAINLDIASAERPVFNLGSGRSMQVIDLVELIAHRCEQLFNFLPPILKSAADQSIAQKTLTFTVDKLLATGFISSSSLEVEIDRTLKACAEWR